MPGFIFSCNSLEEYGTMNDTPIKEVKKPVTVLEQLKKLDEQRSKLLADATVEAKKKADEAIAELNSLGYSYRLVEGDEAPKKASKGKPRQKSEICSICKFGTEPSHDGRHKSHRDQGDNKKPFTEKQLKDLGLEKKPAA
jgi:hypothetical protein